MHSFDDILDKYALYVFGANLDWTANSKDVIRDKFIRSAPSTNKCPISTFKGADLMYILIQ